MLRRNTPAQRGRRKPHLPARLQILLATVNRIQWENKSPSKQSICVKDVRIVAPPAPTVAAAGRH